MKYAEVDRVQFTGLKPFLAGHRCENDKKPTHTRIGDKGAIRGGKYFIPIEKEEEFLYHYFNDVIQKGGDEYLTEKQLGEGGAIVVDLDFRYHPEIRTRQHNENDILDLVSIYLDTLKTMIAFDATNVEFYIYIFEKPSVNLTNDDVTKDGIHVIIGLQMSNPEQEILRDRILQHIGSNPNEIDFINDIPRKESCTWETVFDEGITKGSVNWQIYGSKKPANQAYKLTGVFKILMDAVDGEFCTEPMDVDEYHTSYDKFITLSARYRGHPKYDLKPEVIELVALRASKGGSRKGGRVLNKSPSGNLKVLSRATSTANIIDIANLQSMNTIRTKEQLYAWKDYIEKSHEENAKDHKLSEVHQLALVLPAKFYGDGSYNDWIRLAFALKNTDETMFITWALVSSKKNGFDYGGIPDMYDQWCNIERKSDGNILTAKSIMYWAQEYSPGEYTAVKKTSLGYYVNIAIDHDNDREIAQVLYHLASDRFVCASLTSNSQTWYEFVGHSWNLDRGLRLRKSGISEDLYEVFYNEHVDFMNMIQTDNDARSLEDNEYVGLVRKNKAVTGIMTKCHNNTQKNHIAKEAAELFWDGDFSEKLDQDKYMLGFTNGVVNLQTGEFRDGRPLDYVSKCTLIPYIDDAGMARPENAKIERELVAFMAELFPDPELNEYVWEHLSSVLIGANFAQTFNIYKGSGSNGKSLLVELMSFCLGDYCNPTAPITIITSKRAALGGTTSELYALKSIRYAVFNEPTKGMVLNEGAMKEMTGDAKIQARELYCTSTSFNQMFSLAVCTNSLFEIRSNDDGTWRRLRIIEFKSCFKNADEYDKLPDKVRDSKYIHRKDPTLKERLPEWAPVLMGLLVRRCVKNQGLVKDCEMVLEETAKYRLKQDLIGQFVAEKVCGHEGGSISKQELTQAWKMWCDVNQATNIPKVYELTEFMSSKYPRSGTTGWGDVQMVYETSCDDDL